MPLSRVIMLPDDLDDLFRLAHTCVTSASEGVTRMEYTVISRRILTGTVSDLSPAVRLAWIAILFEAEKLRGRVKLPVRDLAKLASITTPEAAEALHVFQQPDPWSSSKEEEGRRLRPVEGEEDWYDVVTWEKHTAEREAFFNRLRQQRWRARQKGVTDSNGELRDVTKEPEPDREPEPDSKLESLVAAAPDDKPSPKKRTPEKPKVSAKDLVESFTLEPVHRTWAKENAPSVPVEKELEAWKDRCRTSKYRTRSGPIADAQASFYNACRNAEAWGTYRKRSLFAAEKRTNVPTTISPDVAALLARQRGGAK
jgi:hypothetical protein